MSLIFRTVVVFAAALVCTAEEPAASRWEGTVQVPGRPLTVVIDLAQDSAGQWTGSAIVPGFSVKGAPLTDIAISDTAVSFAIKGALGEPVFKGRIAADGALAGEYQQAGHTAPFLLRKSGPPQVDLPRRSSPVGKDWEGAWQGEMNFMGRAIRVTLTLVNHADGKATGQIRFVGRKDTTVNIDLITQESDNLTAEIREAGMIFEGRFRKDSNEIQGTLRQGPLETPLVLRRATEPRP